MRKLFLVNVENSFDGIVHLIRSAEIFQFSLEQFK